MANLRYEIDENNTVSIWNAGDEAPFISQSVNPDNSAWANREDAENWAKNYIANYGKQLPKPAAKSGE